MCKNGQIKKEVGMARRKAICLVIPIFLAIFIAVTTTPALASTTINPRLYGLDRY